MEAHQSRQAIGAGSVGQGESSARPPERSRGKCDTVVRVIEYVIGCLCSNYSDTVPWCIASPLSPCMASSQPIPPFPPQKFSTYTRSTAAVEAFWDQRRTGRTGEQSSITALCRQGGKGGGLQMQMHVRVPQPRWHRHVCLYVCMCRSSRSGLRSRRGEGRGRQVQGCV